MTTKQRSIILVCYQIENNMRMWRFEKQPFPDIGIASGNVNLDTFLFGWYEHGSISDDLLDNGIYLTYGKEEDRPTFGPVALLTIDDIYNGKYFNGEVTGFSDSVDNLEDFFYKNSSFLRGLMMDRLNELVTDIYTIVDKPYNVLGYKIVNPLPDEEWVERSILLSLSHRYSDYYQENYKPILDSDRRSLIRIDNID